MECLRVEATNKAGILVGLLEAWIFFSPNIVPAIPKQDPFPMGTLWKTYSRESVIQFAKETGDMNPIHLAERPRCSGALAPKGPLLPMGTIRTFIHDIFVTPFTLVSLFILRRNLAMTENSMHQARATLSAQSSVRKMTLTGVCVALLAASAYISFPLPFTPAMVTALTIMVNFVAFVMTPKGSGTDALDLSFIGNCRSSCLCWRDERDCQDHWTNGRFQYWILVAAMVMSAVRGKSHDFKKLIMTGIFVGMPIIYIGGCISMYAVNRVSVWATLLTAVIPFLLEMLSKLSLLP